MQIRWKIKWMQMYHHPICNTSPNYEQAETCSNSVMNENNVNHFSQGESRTNKVHLVVVSANHHY